MYNTLRFIILYSTTSKDNADLPHRDVMHCEHRVDWQTTTHPDVYVDKTRGPTMRQMDRQMDDRATKERYDEYQQRAAAAA